MPALYQSQSRPQPPCSLDGNGDGIARFDMGAHEFNPYRFEPALRVTPSGLEFAVRGEPVATVPIPATGPPSPGGCPA